MAAPVVRDGAKAVLREEQHLPVPGIGVQRPAVGERDGGTLAPVLVVDLGSVFGGDGAHDSAPFKRCELRGALCRRRRTDRIRRTPQSVPWLDDRGAPEVPTP